MSVSKTKGVAAALAVASTLLVSSPQKAEAGLHFGVRLNIPIGIVVGSPYYAPAPVVYVPPPQVVYAAPAQQAVYVQQPAYQQVYVVAPTPVVVFDVFGGRHLRHFRR